jgi:hypothetical protein
MEEFSRCPQSQPCPSVPLVKWLPQDELPAICIVAQIEPIRNRAPISNRIADCSPCGPCIHAPYNNVSTEVITRVAAGDEGPLPQVNRECFPRQSPEQIQPIDQNYRFVEADLGPSKRLANTIDD